MNDHFIEAGHLNCPNCALPMHRHRFASTDVRPLEVDVCYGCHAIWFDAYESARLSPDGVVDLFRLIHDKGGASTAQLSTKMSCARCRSPLATTSDIARTNRFSYYRCTQGHGRLTTFLHFLREKQFVRDLTAGERHRLAVHVRQIKCTSCSGPIDIAEQAACTYCGAAVSVLDKDATQKALDHYLMARQRQGALTERFTPVPASARDPGFGMDYLMFNIGTDMVGAFARMAARPASHLGGLSAGGNVMAGASLPGMTDAFAQSGLGDSLSLVDTGVGTGALGEALSGDIGTSLADSAGSFADGLTSAVADSDGGLVDLVTDGIGAIVDGIFN